MATAFKISESARDAMADALAVLVDGGAGNGVCEIFAGPPPLEPATADIGTPLATPVFGDPAFSAATGGVATANAITADGDAAASGDAGHFRCKDSNGVVVYQGTAGEAADDPDMVFTDKGIVAGGTVTISAMTLTMPVGP